MPYIVGGLVVTPVILLEMDFYCPLMGKNHNITRMLALARGEIRQTLVGDYLACLFTCSQKCSLRKL